jgi:hypothetical protein
MNELETAPNLGTTEYSCDEMMQKHIVNAVYPATGNQYFVTQNPNTGKLSEIQAKRITRFLQKQVEKILHDNLEENNPEE